MRISQTIKLTGRQLTGQDESHLVSLACGQRLHRAAAADLAALQADAREAGFQLAVASGFRSFERQCAIWNAKATGQRPVHDDAGRVIAMDALSDRGKVRAILRFSALPGTSRHHWGSDLDVFDAGAMPPGYRLQLSPEEVAPGGVFDPLHCWLDQRMADNRSRGFFRPYALDRGGVAPERWHLSYAPLARLCEDDCTASLLRGVLESAALALWGEVSAELDALIERYVRVPSDWCPRHP